MRVVFAMALTAAALTACGRESGESGAALYAANCAICHGADGRGGGGGGVEGLSKTPPDLTRLSARNGGIFPAASVVAALEGYRADGRHWPRMAGLAAMQSDQQARVRVGGTRVRSSAPIAALLVYLEDIQQP